jgi:hypothetical protein
LCRQTIAADSQRFSTFADWHSVVERTMQQVQSVESVPRGGIDPYAVSHVGVAKVHACPKRCSLTLHNFVRAARGAARTASIVALTVTGVFAFAGALFAALDIWLTGLVTGVVCGGVAWLLDLCWLCFRLTMTQRVSASG